MTRRLEPCPCGSGRRYKDCHGAVKRDPLLARAAELRMRGEYVAALAVVEESLRASPADPIAWNGKAQLHLDLLQIDPALEAIERAIALAPQYSEARYNRSFAYLLRGDYERGWPEHEWRTRVPGYPDYAHYPFGIPRWKGEDVRGKRILVHGEQGNGDTIQFARFLAPLADEGAEIDFFCQQPLVSLMQRVRGVKRAFASLGEAPTHDFHAPILDVAARYLTSLSSPHWLGPYLAPLPERRERAASVFEDVGHPRIGFAWKGSALNPTDHLRSLTPGEAARLVAGDARFFSLQIGAPPLPLPADRVTDLAPHIRDWEDTVALIDALDLVVAVDTAVVHVAGAMGKPVWALVPFSADWRWELEGEKTRWYPSMRIFRQRAPLAWEPVLERVREAYSSMFATSGR